MQESLVLASTFRVSSIAWLGGPRRRRDCNTGKRWPLCMNMHHQLELVDEYTIRAARGAICFTLALNTRHVLLQWELRVIVPDNIAHSQVWPASAELRRLQHCTCHHLALCSTHRWDPKVMMRSSALATPLPATIWS